MFSPIASIRQTPLFRLFSFIITFVLITGLVIPPAQAAMLSDILPAPGQVLGLSAPYRPAILRGITINPDNPLLFDFLLQRGDTPLKGTELKAESEKLVKYFLTALTVPDDEGWVNLSPYEKDQIIADPLAATQMGRTMLEQDYLLKQLTASLTYPETDLGQTFWTRVQDMAFAKFGTRDIPIDNFNKVWIVPERAVVTEEGATAFVVDWNLKVMMEADYQALKGAQAGDGPVPAADVDAQAAAGQELSARFVREIVVPELEKEVNAGTHFAPIRQVFLSVILATWFKQRLRESLLGKVYVDQNKTAGVDTEDPAIKQAIYEQYLAAFKQGVYNLVREDYDADAKTLIPRKYFSGGVRTTLSSPLTILPASQVASSAVKDPGNPRDLFNVSTAATETPAEFTAITQRAAQSSPVTTRDEIKINGETFTAQATLSALEKMQGDMGLTTGIQLGTDQRRTVLGLVQSYRPVDTWTAEETAVADALLAQWAKELGLVVTQVTSDLATSVVGESDRVQMVRGLGLQPQTGLDRIAARIKGRPELALEQAQPRIEEKISTLIDTLQPLSSPSVRSEGIPAAEVTEKLAAWSALARDGDAIPVKDIEDLLQRDLVLPEGTTASDIQEQAKGWLDTAEGLLALVDSDTAAAVVQRLIAAFQNWVEGYDTLAAGGRATRRIDEGWSSSSPVGEQPGFSDLSVPPEVSDIDSVWQELLEHINQPTKRSWFTEIPQYILAMNTAVSIEKTFVEERIPQDRQPAALIVLLDKWQGRMDRLIDAVESASTESMSDSDVYALTDRINNLKDWLRDNLAPATSSPSSSPVAEVAKLTDEERRVVRAEVDALKTAVADYIAEDWTEISPEWSALPMTFQPFGTAQESNSILVYEAFRDGLVAWAKVLYALRKGEKIPLVRMDDYFKQMEDATRIDHALRPEGEAQLAVINEWKDQLGQLTSEYRLYPREYYGKVPFRIRDAAEQLRVKLDSLPSSSPVAEVAKLTDEERRVVRAAVDALKTAVADYIAEDWTEIPPEWSALPMAFQPFGTAQEPNSILVYEAFRDGLVAWAKVLYALRKGEKIPFVRMDDYFKQMEDAARIDHALRPEGEAQLAVINEWKEQLGQLTSEYRLYPREYYGKVPFRIRDAAEQLRVKLDSLPSSSPVAFNPDFDDQGLAPEKRTLLFSDLQAAKEVATSPTTGETWETIKENLQRLHQAVFDRLSMQSRADFRYWQTYDVITRGLRAWSLLAESLQSGDLADMYVQDIARRFQAIRESFSREKDLLHNIREQRRLAREWRERMEVLQSRLRLASVMQAEENAEIADEIDIRVAAINQQIVDFYDDLNSVAAQSSPVLDETFTPEVKAVIVDHVQVIKKILAEYIQGEVTNLPEVAWEHLNNSVLGQAYAAIGGLKSNRAADRHWAAYNTIRNGQFEWVRLLNDLGGIKVLMYTIPRTIEARLQAMRDSLNMEMALLDELAERQELLRMWQDRLTALVERVQSTLKKHPIDSEQMKQSSGKIQKHIAAFQAQLNDQQSALASSPVVDTARLTPEVKGQIRELLLPFKQIIQENMPVSRDEPLKGEQMERIAKAFAAAMDTAVMDVPEKAESDAWGTYEAIAWGLFRWVNIMNAIQNPDPRTRRDFAIELAPEYFDTMAKSVNLELALQTSEEARQAVIAEWQARLRQLAGRVWSSDTQGRQADDLVKTILAHIQDQNETLTKYRQETSESLSSPVAIDQQLFDEKVVPAIQKASKKAAAAPIVLLSELRAALENNDGLTYKDNDARDLVADALGLAVEEVDAARVKSVIQLWIIRESALPAKQREVLPAWEYVSPELKKIEDSKQVNIKPEDIVRSFLHGLDRNPWGRGMDSALGVLENDIDKFYWRDLDVAKFLSFLGMRLKGADSDSIFQAFRKVGAFPWIEDLMDYQQRQAQQGESIQQTAQPQSSPAAPGGIDFDPRNMDLQIRRDAHGVPLPLPMQNLEQIHIDGLYPVILNIAPANLQGLPFLLGLLADQDPPLLAREVTGQAG